MILLEINFTRLSTLSWWLGGFCFYFDRMLHPLLQSLECRPCTNSCLRLSAIFWICDSFHIKYFLSGIFDKWSAWKKSAEKATGKVWYFSISISVSDIWTYVLHHQERRRPQIVCSLVTRLNLTLLCTPGLSQIWEYQIFENISPR